MFEFDNIINRLISELNIKNKTELAKLMGVSTQTMGNWKSRNKIPYEEILTICVNNNLNIKQIVFNIKEEENIKKLNFREENHKIIEQINDKNQEIIYHILQSEKLKLEKL
jgi:DNA-binding XRE family transcriptional regulator